jgi:hypothetical protein
MNADENYHLVRDPFLPWDGAFPYDRLNAILREAGHPGLGPDSTVKAVNDALFDLQMAGAEGYDEAWNELSSLDRRLFLDFCHYPLSETDQADAAGEPESPLPVPLETLRQLAQTPPALNWATAGATAVPAVGESTADTAVAPLPAASRLSVAPLDVGPVWDSSEFWEDLP